MVISFQKKLQSKRLLFLGVFLFFLGLLVGLLIPVMANPRMGLSSHLEGVLNGLFLLALGLIWERLELSQKWLNATFWLTVYGSFANFLAVLIAAATGAGKMMPLAGGQEGSGVVEALVSFLLISLSLAMLTACFLVLIGLYNHLKSK
ncbi:hydrogenase [Aquiflexum gelatinilyticum]|uniref:Hydrogenase n=1 Tax=Aquiflexum gelatinilyticum TaxID=2961943 RepID=A0A9X2T1B8_9BACT|nr:hydrogenase [Aquiflexum gelatinilyticum]MCR9015756.1 hydrogenase [Aquiflexum gelatinilyticum]